MTLTLAELGKRYFAELEIFNALEAKTDEQTDAQAETWKATERLMVGVPVRSNEDALAAVDWLINHGEGCMIDLSGDEIAGSLMRELRAYLARKVAS
jgi:hypothetical protein